MRDPRLGRLADVLVGYSAAVKPGDLVRVQSPAAGSPLVEEVVRRVLRAGGHPLVRMTPDALGEIVLKESGDAQLSYQSPLAMAEVEAIDCHIGLWAEANTRALTNCDPAKSAAMAKARRPVGERFLQRAAEGKLRWIGTQYPTQASAQDAEMSLSEYEDFVFAAGLLDAPDPAAAWRAVSERQQRLTDYLNGSKDYRVVAANGTDLRMSVEGRTWINCDGHENFPDGEVFTGPVEKTVNGTVAFSFPAVHLGRECDGVRLKFRDGVVVDATASKGEDFLISMLDTDPGARRLGECAIGTNYSITRYTKNTLFDEKIGGTAHFAVGSGYPETGNRNESGLHWDLVVDLRRGGLIEVDGEKVSVDGRFTREGFPSA